jgi:hypothetical protein
MRKINTRELPELTWSSPKGKFGGVGKEVSEALGRKPDSRRLEVPGRKGLEIDHSEPIKAILA